MLLGLGCFGCSSLDTSWLLYNVHQMRLPLAPTSMGPTFKSSLHRQRLLMSLCSEEKWPELSPTSLLVSLCLSVCLSVCLSLSVYICMSVCLCLYLYLCWYLSLSVSVCLCLSICLVLSWPFRLDPELHGYLWGPVDSETYTALCIGAVGLFELFFLLQNTHLKYTHLSIKQVVSVCVSVCGISCWQLVRLT